MIESVYGHRMGSTMFQITTKLQRVFMAPKHLPKQNEEQFDSATSATPQ